MFVTEEVLKLDKSSVVRLLQPLNMELMFVTAEVLKLDKSNVERLLQFGNM